MADYKKYPYRTEFPDSSESARSHQSLEDALHWARWTIYSRWRETNEYGNAGDYVHDATTAVITNRNTGYRWILRRDESVVEFQTPDMLEDSIAEFGIDVHLTVEEAEALARTAISSAAKDKRTKALTGQALDQIGLLCRQVRERVRLADTFIDAWTRSIPRRTESTPGASEDGLSENPAPSTRPPYRPLGDPDNLSLKEAGEILGKARNTLFLWYRQGKLPPAVDVAPFLHQSKPCIVVPRYRLDAWRAGQRMPSILQEVFETRALHEPPWVCWSARKGASRGDIEFWIHRRAWQLGVSKDGRRIYGDGLEEGKAYELFPLDPRG